MPFPRAISKCLIDFSIENMQFPKVNQPLVNVQIQVNSKAKMIEQVLPQTIMYIYVGNPCLLCPSLESNTSQNL